ncbi:PssD/Cps14F family polysaccharide biosynthesis glycosyltransferase [Anthocerotibacter panamensis]|uniref:PssD/Cps14F family polysaccharide biosynthesis glycosyltransferase n=1 Tax=Anthocerotibacter panamensis TaxID=2857077 RepID=UPI001FDAA309|nr:PssD/Cps14F family polysaccharide biosynthesis glycosyltransferase [Anthocerotibacter panamensis]
MTCEIAFIIVAHNSSRTLEAAIGSCIRAVQERYPGRGQVVVYDNASQDRTGQILDQFACAHPDLFLGIKGKENLGYGQANNRAMECVPSRYYALVNPDVRFEPEMLGPLLTALETDPKAVIVCPQLLYPDHTRQPSVRHFPTLAYFLLKNLLGQKLQQRLYPFTYAYSDLPEDRATPVDWGIGAFLLVSGDYVRKYGLFDERFFLYFEDVDLCLKAWQNHGKVLYEPRATAYHLYQRASTRTSFNYLRLLHTLSGLKFFAKNRNLWWKNPAPRAPQKLLLVCSPGGHLSTMMGLQRFWSHFPREWVSYEKINSEQLHRGQEVVHWVEKQEARDFSLKNFLSAFAILRQSRPDLILSTGASLAVPFLFAGKVLGIKTIYIESISRASDLSMTGKLVYNLVDEFYVQWPECTERYPKAQYQGIVQ